jgi:prephenate dehydratase
MEIFFFVDVTFEKYADYVKTKALLEIMAEYFKVLGNIKHRTKALAFEQEFRLRLII